MAANIRAQLILEQSSKRQRLNHFPKLLPNEQVEVRSVEEGFQGSWHSGIVIEARTQFRMVKYDHLLCDDSSSNLIESIPVLFAVDGKIPAGWRSSDFPNYRGKIRPVPPRFIHDESCLHYGQCVDVFYKDAWWEGVIFDHFDGSDERLVFFPDMGDELKTPFEYLRLTQDWDAGSDEWMLRRDWIFLEVIEELKQEWPFLVSVKQIWYEVRMTKCFVEEMKEWMCPVKQRWKETVKEVMVDNFKLTMVEFFHRFNFSEDLHEDRPFLDIKKRILDSIINLEPSFFESLVVEEEFATLRSNPDPHLVVKSDYENLSSPSENPISEWSKCVDYCVIGSDVFPQAECCPDAIFKYFEYFESGKKPPVDVTLKVRQHLSYMGWKIESKVYRIGSKGAAYFRYRYTDPNGKQYYSLNVLCTELNKRSSESITLSSSDVNAYLETPISSTLAKEEPKTLVIESDFCPQAVVDYCSLSLEANSDLRKSRDARVRKLQTSATKHLFAVGWSKCYTERLSGRKVLVYCSPNGRKFYGLLEACNHYIKECLCCGFDNIRELDKMGKVKAYVDLIKKKDGLLHIKTISSSPSKKQAVKQDESLTKSRNRSTGDSLRTTHVLRSSKRARKEISPMNQTPRTVLSWLIDNNVVLPRAKVQYYCRKDGRTLREGRVTRDGIKCSCCKHTFSLSKFQSHAGSTYGRPSANIFLEDGRSLLDCQCQLQQNLDKSSRLIRMKPLRIKGNRHEIENDNDYICSICQYGGELVLCDECPSAFHTTCLGLKEVPDGEWFCPSCCCRICNQNRFNGNYEQNMDMNILNCEQCERRYHIGCLKRREGFLKMETYLEANWFCSLRCEEIFVGLHRLLGKSIPVGRDNLTWTLLKYKKSESTNYDASDMEELAENYSKLNVAISVMHECFEPVKEPRTGRDITEDRRSELQRLNFKGFYTVLLEKDDELISTAVVRVISIFFNFIYSYDDVNVLLSDYKGLWRESSGTPTCWYKISVSLVLPAVSSVLHTWTRSFGFSLMTESEKLKFLGCTFLDFQGTRMCHKLLVIDLPSTEPSMSRGNGCGTIVDLDRISAVSKVSQEERIQESGKVEQSSSEHNGKTNPLEILTSQPTNIEHRSETKCSTEASNPREGNNNSFLKCYQRRKFMPTRFEV
ncbi:Agenet-like domain-containing protein [Cynara cardunculus var. scolymus]|uniref:Agenet-like domain-containing protein n=1 Tax=Cynara cardunculus var. scolymus TaxID=59895 RepID=A0A118K220_CYNCS|nr:Agenet-like domain-containing protein [Cynara cardunculus var. scolymus]